jgi:hypothetical protein
MWNISFCCRVAKITKDGLAPIEMVITVDGQRSFRRLSMKVSPDEFKKLISCKRDNYIKQFCDNERIKAYEVFRKLEMLGMPITPAIVKEGLTSGVSFSYRLSNLLEDFNAIISKRVGVDLCLNVYKKYVRIMKYVVVFLDDKECRLITNGDMKRIVADMRAKYQNSTFANLWVIVKSFITYGINNNRIPNNNLFATIKVVKKPKKVEYLTMEELNRIRDTPYSNPSLQRVADFAVLEANLGLAYCDLVNIKRDDINESATYSVTMSSNNNDPNLVGSGSDCTTVTETFTLTKNPYKGDLDVDVACFNEVILTDETEITPIKLNGQDETPDEILYQIWSYVDPNDGKTYQIQGNPVTVQLPLLEGEQSRTHNIGVMLVTANDCRINLSTTATVNRRPEVEILGDPTICNGEEKELQLAKVSTQVAMQHKTITKTGKVMFMTTNGWMKPTTL